jgi:predicted permease
MRAMSGFGFLDGLRQDLRYGFRLLGKSPGFTAVVVLSLALGIGANTAIFSLIDAVMLRMLPVKSPEQLVLLSWASPKWEATYHNYSGWGGCGGKPGMKSGCSFSYPVFEDIQAHNGVFSEVLADGGMDEVNLVLNGRAGLTETEPVSGGYFATLGVQPILGRAITPEDDRPGAVPVAVIGEGLWERRFGREASALGRAVSINGATFTIVGVAPARFAGLQPGFRKDLWIPLAMLPNVRPSMKASMFHQRDAWWVIVVGRLKPGVGEVQARAALDVIFRQGLTAAPKPQQLPHIELSSASKGLEVLRQFYAKPLLILMAVVGLVLLIACANVANLLLARATARQKEIAVRLSLGAGRRRITRQLLAESLLLSLAGGAMGLILGYWLSDLLLALVAAGQMRISLEVHPDARVLVFTIAVSVLTGILFGIAPALRGTRVDLSPALKANAGSLFGSAGRRSRLGLGKGLVAAQVAMSLLLLVGAGLFLRTLVNLGNVNLGFNPRNILLFGLNLTHSAGKDHPTATFYRDLLARLQALPGVVSTSLSQATLVSGSLMRSDYSFEGYTPAPHEDMSADVLPVGPRFFETMGIPLRLGRSIELQDTERDAKVAVVNEALVHRYYRGQNPVGRHLGGDREEKQETEIVGLVGDAKYDDIREQAPPTIYTPYQLGKQNPKMVYFEVRTAGDPNALIPTVRRVVEQMESDLPLLDVKTQTSQIDEMLVQERMFAKLTSAFGLLALVLACVGIYGIMAYAVVRRTSEIGIRMALGAERRSILTMVMRETLLLVVMGVAIGIPVALAATRLISSMLYGLKPSDPVTLAAATGVMLAVAACAGYLPARRASRVDPMVALRDE